MRFLLLICLVCVSQAFEDKTVTQYLTDNGYTTLVSALQSTGLASALDGAGPFTVFAPTNAAFNGVNVGALSNDSLRTVLLYHVINEFVLVPMISQATTKTTMAKQDLTLEPTSGGLGVNRGTSNPASVSSSNSDIIVNNGVIQPINSVLMPPVLPTPAPVTTTTQVMTTTAPTYDIFQILLRDENNVFKDLSIALVLAELAEALGRDGTDYTLFAPVDSAFGRYKDNLLDPTDPNAKTIYQEVLKYHVVFGGRTASQLRTGELYTLHGTSVNVTVGTGVMVNTANVIIADMIATNGVVHAIDNLLVPQDINSLVNGGTGKK